MTPEKTKEALAALCQIAKENGAGSKRRLDENLRAVRFDTEHRRTSWQLDHIYFIAHEAQTLVNEGRIEKAMRHLGWAQGALWGMGILSIEELMNMNRPDESKEAPSP